MKKILVIALIIVTLALVYTLFLLKGEKMDKIISLSLFELITLGLPIFFGVLNIIQFRSYRQIRKETLNPIYNGLIGLFNTINHKLGYWFVEKAKFLKEEKIPYDSIPALKRNFYEFVSDTLSYLSDLREHIVSTLKTIEPDQNKVFQAADYLLTDQQKLEKLQKELAFEKEQKRIELEKKQAD